jgi:hypothetical protein
MIGKMLAIYEVVPESLKSVSYFIIDSDKGKQSIKKYLDRAICICTEEGFKKYNISGLPTHVYIISLPDGEAMEDLFDEYMPHVTKCVYDIWAPDFSLNAQIPTNLSRCASQARTAHITDERSATDLIKNMQDTKDIFWAQKDAQGYKINASKLLAMKKLLGLVDH